MRFRLLASMLAAATVLTLLPATSPPNVAERAARLEHEGRAAPDPDGHRDARRGRSARSRGASSSRLRATPEARPAASRLARRPEPSGCNCATPPARRPRTRRDRLNQAISNPAGDVETSACQSEVMIASDGNNVMAAWNDGEGWGPRRATGVAYSNDAGNTWDRRRLAGERHDRQVVERPHGRGQREDPRSTSARWWTRLHHERHRGVEGTIAAGSLTWERRSWRCPRPTRPRCTTSSGSWPIRSTATCT